MSNILIIGAGIVGVSIAYELSKSNNINILLKRYEIWKDLYSSNKKIAYKLLH